MENIKLTNEEIDRVTQEAISFFKSNGIEKKEVTRNRLLIEEVLVKYQERFGVEQEAGIVFSKVLGQIRCVISLKGEAFNPLEMEDEITARMMSSLLDYIGGVPNWTYKNDSNVVYISAKRKTKVPFFAKIIIGLIAGIIGGLIMKRVLPTDIASTVTGDYLLPLTGAFSGVLGVMAELLIFFAFPVGIAAIGNASSVGKISTKAVGRMYLVMGIPTLLYGLLFLISGTMSSSSNVSVAGKALFDIIIGFVPTNIAAPFLNFNSIGILIMGIMFGFSFLAMGEKASRTVDVFDTLNLAAILTNNYLNNFIPYYVCISILCMIVNADFAALSRVPTIILYSLLGFVILIAAYTLYISKKFKMTPREYIKKMLPTFLICLSSGSFGAAFTTAINAVLDMGTEVNITGFIINMGSALFKPAHAITFIVSSVVLADVFGVEISVAWLILAVALSIILTAAVPNVPGASASVYALLFSQLGLPNAALTLMISINAFFEFVLVAVNFFCLQSEIVIQALPVPKEEAA